MAAFVRMMERWNVSALGVVAILAAFSLAGMTVVRLKRPVLAALLPGDAPEWLQWTVYVLVIVPLYQVCLLAWGTALGQFRFFWAKLKHTSRFLLGWLVAK